MCDKGYPHIKKTLLLILTLVTIFIFFINIESIGAGMKYKSSNKKVKIDKTDGINKEEAIAIAKKFMIEKGRENEVRISRARIHRVFTNYRLKDGHLVSSIAGMELKTGDYTEEKIWDVIFPPKNKGFFKIGFHDFVHISQKTGEIVGWGTYKW